MLYRYQILVLILAVLIIPARAGDLRAPGVPNFHQVNEHVYRGGQPAPLGWSSLAKLGVKVVIDLRPSDEHPTTVEAEAVEAAGMHYINIPMSGFVAPKDEQVSKVLDLLSSSSDGPVFVHCRRGSDRTGTVIACYRIIHDRWENQKALKEAKSYGMYWTELGMRHYIMNFKSAPERLASGSDPQPSTSVDR